MLTWETLVPIASFLAIALGAWGTLTALADRQGRAVDRLERLMRGARKPTGDSELTRRQDRIQAIVNKAAPTLAKPLQGKEEELSQVRLKLLNAGFRGEQALQIFLAAKFLLLVVALAVAIPSVYAKYGFGRNGICLILLAGAVGFYLPGLYVALRRRSRMEEIFLSLPDALDLMVVCVEAGLGLDPAMRRVAGELAAACPCLCEEIAIANFQLQMGRPRREVLHDLGRRTGVPDVRSLAAILIQAERFGSSIATALRVQSDSMRIRRRQLAEERAAKTAVQLIFPLVLFIFPGIFVVLVGPAGIQIATTLMNR
jgi:tight adherence protein C